MLNLLLALLLQSPAFAGEISTYCRDLADARVPGQYCVFKTDGSKRPDILYYFHGMGGSAKNWPQNRKGILEEWARKGYEAPIVVGVSFGPTWALTDNSDTDLFNYFIRTAMPRIEADVGVPGDRRRFLLGESMGGFNASQLVLKKPALFAKAVLLCPAIPAVSIYASSSEIEGYIAESGADPAHVRQFVDIGRRYFSTPEAWTSADPLELGKAHLGPSSPALHVSCGDKDEYGFQVGARRFAEEARRARVRNVVWKALHGRHCTVDDADVARFLAAR